MKLLVDFFPLILFFVAFKLKGIFVATAVAIAATVLQLLYVWRKHGKVEPMHWASLMIIVVFGGATLWSEDPIFIKWKPTVLYWPIQHRGSVSYTHLTLPTICSV